MAESKSKTSEISIQVDLNENNLPVEMRWNAEDSNIKNSLASAFFLSLWDPKQKKYDENRSLDQRHVRGRDETIFSSIPTFYGRHL
jgi:hypothetical protein